jgi:hypothetical protein
MALFEFELRPVDAIEPWGKPPDLSLHWFGLSDGSYHLDLGDVRLLEYAERPGWPRYVEYQLARFHEDLLDMLPDVLEPLPAGVVRLLRGGSVSATRQELGRRHRDRGRHGVVYDESTEAFRLRLLDSLYLTPGFGIWIWSHEAKVVIEWDNREQLVDGRAAWTASVGRREMARTDFVEELISFDQRLMEAMSERIRLVEVDWSRPEVSIDIERLQSEQAERSAWLSSALNRKPSCSDWEAIRKELSSEGGGSA